MDLDSNSLNSCGCWNRSILSLNWGSNGGSPILGEGNSIPQPPALPIG